MALESFEEMLWNCKAFSRIYFIALRWARYEDSCFQVVAVRGTAWGERFFWSWWYTSWTNLLLDLAHSI